LQPHLKQYWAIPPEQNAAFVAAMEDVLTVYQRPPDSAYPVICMDETSKQLVGETRISLPAGPGQPRREDYEYERHGVANLFLFCEPLTGGREVRVTERRTRTDWAEAMRDLSDRLYPTAQRITVVLDNLNTHGPASFYEAFAPDEARRLAERFEFHYTPKHGSWLNVAEIELSVLSRQCLDRRISRVEVLRNEIGAWQQKRNQASKAIDWQFTTAEARTKLKRLYPVIKA
jgi:DDE superfamily endonuclease